MSDIVIKAENLGKKYLIGHQSKWQSSMSFRDVLMNNAHTMWQKTRDLFCGRPVVQGDTLEEVWALKDVSFDIRQGEAVGIIGRNGAGKSTLLKILSRITEPTEGRVTIRGRVASLLEVGTGFHPELAGRENIYLNGAIMGMTRAEIKRKFDEIVAFAEVEKFLDTPVKRYSSGMYVRLAFAVAAHLEPEILVVDEVLAVGDIAFQKKCLGKMGEVAEEGRTIIFVSHQMSAIRTLCKRAIIVRDGEIFREGHSNEIVRIYEDSMAKKITQPSAIAIRSPNDTQDLNFYFKGAKLLNAQEMPATRFRYNEIMNMIIDFSGEPLTSHYSVEFRIFGEVGDILKSTNNIICVGASGPFHNLYFDKKIKSIRINIGPLMLSSGCYSISLSAMTGSVRADTWENACSFHIIECQPFEVNQEVNSAGYILKHSFSALKNQNQFSV